MIPLLNTPHLPLPQAALSAEPVPAEQWATCCIHQALGTCLLSSGLSASSAQHSVTHLDTRLSALRALASVLICGTGGSEERACAYLAQSRLVWGTAVGPSSTR